MVYCVFSAEFAGLVCDDGCFLWVLYGLQLLSGVGVVELLGWSLVGPGLYRGVECVVAVFGSVCVSWEELYCVVFEFERVVLECAVYVGVFCLEVFYDCVEGLCVFDASGLDVGGEVCFCEGG